MNWTLLYIIGILFSHLWTSTGANEISTTESIAAMHEESKIDYYNNVPVSDSETYTYIHNRNEDLKNATYESSEVFQDTIGTQDISGSPNEPQNEFVNGIKEYPAKILDVNGTVQEVEKILAANPELPQLSRSEILEILDNITIQDQITTEAPNEVTEHENEDESSDTAVTQVPSEENTLKPENYKTHDEYLRAMRALMLVLPFNAKNLSESKIQELYTKTPITRLVGERPDEILTTTTLKPSVITTRLTTVTEEPQHNQQYDNQSKIQSNHHEMYHQPYDSQPIQSESNYNYESETKSTLLTTEQSIATTTTTKRFNHYNQRPNHHHRRRRPTTPSTTEHSTTIVPEIYVSQHYQTTKLSSIEPSVTTIYPERTSNHKTDHYYKSPKFNATQQSVTTIYPERNNLQENNISLNHIDVVNPHNNIQIQFSLQNKTQNEFRPIPSWKKTKPTSTSTVSEPLSTTESTGLGLDLPHDMKNLLISFNVDDHLTEPHISNMNKQDDTSIFVTPSTEIPKKTGSISDLTKYSSQYLQSDLAFERTTTQKPEMRDDVKEILASIGLFPDKGKQERVPEIQSTLATTISTSTVTPDIAAAAESLSPEMKELLISFGLLPSANDIQQASYQDSETERPGQAYDQQAASPAVDPSSYLSFKPLPLTESENKGKEEDKYLMNSDMKQFLASFGLISTSDSEEGYSSGGSFSEHGFRSQKALNIEDSPLTNNSNNITDQEPDIVTTEISNGNMPHINMDMLSDDMKEILENLGFLPSTNLTIAVLKRKTSDSEGHIFNPAAHLASLHPTEEEAQRLTKLLDTIKKLMKENGTITQDEIDALNASISYILPPVPVEESNETTGSDTNTPPVLFVQKKQVNKSVPLDQVNDAPDPLSLEELLLTIEEEKNEVKRQQNNNTSSNSTEETTTQDPGPSLTDLAASFGGGETAPDDASVDDALPPKKPNGLYFLLDWNTFLDVGEGTKRRVNLQFSPKLGNSRAFLPVTVP